MLHVIWVVQGPYCLALHYLMPECLNAAVCDMGRSRTCLSREDGVTRMALDLGWNSRGKHEVCMQLSILTHTSCLTHAYIVQKP